MGVNSRDRLSSRMSQLALGGALVCIAVVSSAAPVAAAGPGDAPVRKTVLESKDVERQLTRTGSMTLEQVTVKGDLRLPTGTKSFSATSSTFEGRITAERLTGGPDITINDSVIKGRVSMAKSAVGALHLEKTEFASPVDFTYMKIGELWFNSSIFDSSVDLSYTEIRGMLNLFDVKLGGYTDFTNAKFSELDVTELFASAPINIELALLEPGFDDFESWVEAGGEGDLHRRASIYQATLRFWKRNFDEINRPRDAQLTNRRLILSQYRYFLTPTDFEWWTIRPMDWLTAYGTRPFRPLLISAALILLFALLFMATRTLAAKDGKSVAGQRRSLASLTFSVQNFIPFVKVYDREEWGWTTTPNHQWLVTLERVVGLVISGVAAFSVGSYVL